MRLPEKSRQTVAQQGEAVARSKKLQRNDTIHNIFVGEVGKWLPWEPDPNSVADQEYAEDQLNTLMKKYKENEEARENFVSTQRAERKTKGVKGMDGAAAPEAVVPEAVSGSGSYEGLFSGPADLALERKMQKKEE